MKKTWAGKWIWCAGQDVHGYNLAAQFKKEFEAGEVKNAILRITADSRYRVSLNGKWINDGPGKAYAEHWTYDVYDIAPLLKTGINRIEVTARYYGIGTFHQIPQQAGLLAEIELDGKTLRLRIDAPEGVEAVFRPNEEHRGFHVVLHCISEGKERNIGA